MAMPLLEETRGLVGAAEFELMADDGWLINVARGAHVVTDDLVAALESGTIGGAAVDVIDPEPLPDEHRLWELENMIITPHVANTPRMARPLLSARIRANVSAHGAGSPYEGQVDINSGY